MSAITGEYRGHPAEVAVVETSVTTAQVSWGAIMAGAVVAVSVGAMLNLLGIATASSLVEMVSRDTPSAGSMAIGSGVWLAVTTAIGILLGAIVAARLAHSWSATDATLHGLAVWAVAMLLAMVLLGSALSGGIAAGAQGLGNAAGGIASAAGSGVARLTPEDAFSSLRGRLLGQTDPAASPREEQIAEATRIFVRRLSDGGWNGPDRARLEVLVASIAGIERTEAAGRITETEQAIQSRLREAEEAARQAADTAAKSTAIAAFWAFAAMLLGLGAAVLGARMALSPAAEARRADRARIG